MMKRYGLLAVVLMALATGLAAQGRFDAAVMAGGTLNQIDGDNSGGYNLIGLRGGVGTSFPMGEADGPWRWVVETAFVQKGSHLDNGSFDRTIGLNYVEVVLMASYTTAAGHLRLAAGLAPAVMVGARVVDNGDTRVAALEEQYRRFDWLPLTVGVRYMLGKHVGIEVRYQESLLSVNTETASGVYRFVQENKGAFNRSIGIGLTYKF